jgi:hypothetical protein
MVLLITIFLGFAYFNASSKSEVEEKKIRVVINAYFEKRYQSRKTNQLADFQDLKSKSLQADAFFRSELDKTEIEIYNAKLHHLGYVDYDFTLDYKNINLNKENESAAVSLLEGYDIVFEISQMINPDEPIVSKMRNLKHEILLVKEQEEWKIISDEYEDSTWRMLKETKLSKEEVIRSITGAQVKVSEKIEPQSNSEFPYLCSDLLPLNPDVSAHPYNRNGAVAYAHKYALTPNPGYYYFPSNDCTNFVNQAIHHGSNAEEIGSGTFGWYYNSGTDYSASWSEVNFLFDFITQPYFNARGPEGCQYYYATQTEAGDLVQFEWGPDNDTNGDALWDHTAIIVSKYTPPNDPGNPYIYIAQHSDNLDNHPLNVVIYQSIRFLHIERIDGYIRNFLPIIIKSDQDNYYWNAGPTPAILGSYGNAYPAPATVPYRLTNEQSPYPAP